MDTEWDDDSAVMDVLDKQIVHGLVCDARIPFARLGAILGVSEQTVARRYRSLRKLGILHVSGQVNVMPLGHARWILRLESAPSRAVALAESLARVPDLNWVSLLSTGSEVMCVCRPRSLERRDELLLRQLPRVSQLKGMVAHEVLRAFPFEEEWPRYSYLLSAEQLRELGPRPVMWEPTGPKSSVVLSREDEIMMTVLGRDGRAPYAQLAAATGWSATRVARRMSELLEAGVLYFDLDFALEKMGYTARASLWLQVRPGHLDGVGKAMATHPEVAYVAATAGPSNLMASIACRDASHLYRYVTERLGPLEGINNVEVTPVLRLFKQSQALVEVDRVTVLP